MERSKIQGAFSQKILRLWYTLRTSSSSRRNTTSAIVCQQTIVTTTSSHSQSLVTFENIRNHKIMIFVKRIFAPDICLWLRSLLRFFMKRGPELSIWNSSWFTTWAILTQFLMRADLVWGKMFILWTRLVLPVCINVIPTAPELMHGGSDCS